MIPTADPYVMLVMSLVQNTACVDIMLLSYAAVNDIHWVP